MLLQISDSVSASQQSAGALLNWAQRIGQVWVAIRYSAGPVHRIHKPKLSFPKFDVFLFYTKNEKIIFPHWLDYAVVCFFLLQLQNQTPYPPNSQNCPNYLPTLE